MSYSSNISISARHASDLCGVIRLAPSLWGTAPSSSLISCSTKLQQPISALCFENTSAFRFRRYRAIFRNLPHLFSLLSVLSLTKPVCQILVHMTRGVPENSSSLISRRPFRISLKTIYGDYTKVTTANISAFGAPYFISVSLKTLLPYAIGRRTVLPFHSCS